METTTLGPHTLGAQKINKGIYWAIAAILVIMLTFIFTASRPKSFFVPDSNTSSSAPSGVGLVPSQPSTSPINMDLSPNTDTLNRSNEVVSPRNEPIVDTEKDRR